MCRGGNIYGNTVTLHIGDDLLGEVDALRGNLARSPFMRELLYKGVKAYKADAKNRAKQAYDKIMLRKFSNSEAKVVEEADKKCFCMECERRFYDEVAEGDGDAHRVYRYIVYNLEECYDYYQRKCCDCDISLNQGYGMLKQYVLGRLALFSEYPFDCID